MTVFLLLILSVFAFVGGMFFVYVYQTLTALLLFTIAVLGMVAIIILMERKQ